MLFESFANVHTPTPGPSKSAMVPTLSWMMPFEIVCKRTHYPFPGNPKSRIRAKILLTLTRTMPLFEIVCKCTYDPTPGPSQFMLIAEMVLILSWTMLFEIVSKSMHDPLPEPKSYDCSWDRPYIVMNDAIRNRLQRYAWPTPGASAPVSIAKTMLTLSWTMVMKSIAKVHMA